MIGSVAVLDCTWNSQHLSTWEWRLNFSVCAFLISISTVFLKQHSVLDILGAIQICVLTWWAVYGKYGFWNRGLKMNEFLKYLMRFALIVSAVLAAMAIGLGAFLLLRPELAVEILLNAAAVLLIIGGVWVLLSMLVVLVKVLWEKNKK